MPLFATIQVSNEPLSGWWDGKKWTEKQSARCSNDFLSVASGPPTPPFNATNLVWQVVSTEAEAIDFDVALDRPGDDPILFPSLRTGSVTALFPTKFDYSRGVYIASVRNASAPFTLQLFAEDTKQDSEDTKQD